jgi:Druantia protein DruA
VAQPPKVAQALTFAGRMFSVEELQLIQEISRDYRSLGRTEISRTICELLQWKRPNGGLKNQECRVLLERLQERGFLSLPELRPLGRRGERAVHLTEQSDPEPVMVGSAGDFEPLYLQVVEGSGGDSHRWRELIERYHYLHYRVPVGANLRYLVGCSRYPDRVLACLLWSSPAWTMMQRDRWIGWSAEQRRRNLQLIVNNARFLILPWVQVRGLASKILSLCARQLPADWEKRYGYRPLLLETLVDGDRFRGTCYRAANWIALGRTRGRGRMDRNHSSQGRAPKDIYVYPLCRNVRERLVTAVSPDFSAWAEELS